MYRVGTITIAPIFAAFAAFLFCTRRGFNQFRERRTVGSKHFDQNFKSEHHDGRDDDGHRRLADLLIDQVTNRKNANQRVV